MEEIKAIKTDEWPKQNMKDYIRLRKELSYMLDELKKDSDLNKAQLEKLMGMDKLMEQVAKDMPDYDEIAE